MHKHRSFLLYLSAFCCGASLAAPGQAGVSERITDSEWTLSLPAGVTEVPVDGAISVDLMRLVCKQYSSADGGEPTELCFPMRPTKEELAQISVEWLVNGTAGGTSRTGTIRTYNASGALARGKSGLVPIWTVYAAPPAVPPGNPVDISAVIRTKGKSEIVQLVRQVRVIDFPGWRGSIRVHLYYSHDPNELGENLIDRSVLLDPDFSIFDKNRPVERTVIEGDFTYTITGTVAESVKDDGTRFLALNSRPSGTIHFYRRENATCRHALDVAEGKLSDIYRSVPLMVTVETLPGKASAIRLLPGIAFDMGGRASLESCDSTDSWTYDNMFDGVTFGTDQIVPPPDMAELVALVGGNDSKSISGVTRIPAQFRYAGNDYEGEAEISWSLSKK